MLKSPFFMSASCEQALRLRDVGISHARTAVGRRCFAMGSRVFPRLALLATQNGESTQRRHVFRVCVCFFFLFCNSIQTGTGTSSLVNLPRSDTKSSNLFTKGQPCYKSTSYNFLKRAPMRSRQRERRSREVDLFRLSGFESYYKFTRGKTNTGVFLELLRLRHAKTLSLLLVNCHNVTGEIFNQ